MGNDLPKWRPEGGKGPGSEDKFGKKKKKKKGRKNQHLRKSTGRT